MLEFPMPMTIPVVVFLIVIGLVFIIGGMKHDR